MPTVIIDPVLTWMKLLASAIKAEGPGELRISVDSFGGSAVWERGPRTTALLTEGPAYDQPQRDLSPSTRPRRLP